jgi:four helix bundle protein
VKESIVKDKSFEFALAVIELYKQMKVQNEFVLSKQLLRSGTSIGANIEEALAGQSHRDFTAKMSIASKEARESLYWIRLIDKSEIVKIIGLNELKEKNTELIRMLTAIVKTAQTKPTKN